MYLKDLKGKARFWAIESDSDGYTIEHGVLGGQTQEERYNIPYGLASRTKQEQIDSRVAAKIKKRLEKGYSLTLEDAMAQDGRAPNELGRPRPMLAARYDKLKGTDFSGYYHQPKLDGHRCLIAVDGDEVQAYSRNGKPIEAIVEILEEAQAIGRDIILDGELYSHGVPLQTITSWVKRRQECTDMLEYWVYDCVLPDSGFEERFNTISNILEASFKRIRLCPTYKGVPNAIGTLQSYRKQGYEGAILRKPEAPYQPGIRSKSVVKVKAFEDDEFKVTGVTASVEGWGILHCRTKDGKIFKVSAPGNISQKRHVLEHLEDYVGMHVRVEYAGHTVDGIPFHPVATMWRNKDDE